MENNMKTYKVVITAEGYETLETIVEAENKEKARKNRKILKDWCSLNNVEPSTSKLAFVRVYGLE